MIDSTFINSILEFLNMNMIIISASEICVYITTHPKPRTNKENESKTTMHKSSRSHIQRSFKLFGNPVYDFYTGEIDSESSTDYFLFYCVTVRIETRI